MWATWTARRGSRAVLHAVWRDALLLARWYTLCLKMHWKKYHWWLYILAIGKICFMMVLDMYHCAEMHNASWWSSAIFNRKSSFTTISHGWTNWRIAWTCHSENCSESFDDTAGLKRYLVRKCGTPAIITVPLGWRLLMTWATLPCRSLPTGQHWSYSTPHHMAVGQGAL